MTSGFNGDVKRAIQKYMPEAILVIPKIYVQQQVVDCLLAVFIRTRAEWTRQETRKYAKVKRLLGKSKEELSETEQELLAEWKCLAPANQKAYELKEAVFALLESENRKEALARIEEWLKNVSLDVQIEFTPMVNGFTNWLEEVLGAFDYAVPNFDGTNLEEMYRKWPLMKIEKVTSFEAIRGRLLLDQSHL